MRQPHTNATKKCLMKPEIFVNWILCVGWLDYMYLVDGYMYLADGYMFAGVFVNQDCVVEG